MPGSTIWEKSNGEAIKETLAEFEGKNNDKEVLDFDTDGKNNNVNAGQELRYI